MKRWQIIIGIILIVLGIFSLLNQVFPGLRIGRFFMPLVLIGLGTLLILRPRVAGPGVMVQFPILGDLRKTGPWKVTDHEIWWFVGSNRFDFSEAIFPNDEATVKILGFVTDIKIIIPEDVGLCVESSSFFTEYNGMLGKEERFLNLLQDQSPNYLQAEKRVNLQIYAFVSEIKVRPSLM